MYAVLETGGKQYRVEEGDILRVEKLDIEEGNSIDFDKVLLLSNDNGLSVGKPFVEGAKVEASVLGHGKGKKIIIFKYRAKKHSKRKQGHRQPYTKIKIEKIVG